MGLRYAAAADDLLRPVFEGAGQLASGGLYMLGYLYDRNMIGYGSNFTQSTAPGAMVSGMEGLFMSPGSGG